MIISLYTFGYHKDKTLKVLSLQFFSKIELYDKISTKAQKIIITTPKDIRNAKSNVYIYRYITSENQNSTPLMVFCITYHSNLCIMNSQTEYVNARRM